MDASMSLDQLRELFLTTEASRAARTIAIVGSLLLAATVLQLVRRGSLREEYTPIWLIVSVGIVLVSVRMDLLHATSRLLGAWTPSSTLFFLGELFLVAICLNFAVRLSRTSLQLKNLSQEVALLRSAIEDRADRSPPG